MKKITIAILSIVLTISMSTTSAFAAPVAKSASYQVVSSVGYQTDSLGTGTRIVLYSNPDGCVYGIGFYDALKEQALHIAITALAAGKRISVNYNQDGGSCTGTGIYLMP